MREKVVNKKYTHSTLYLTSTDNPVVTYAIVTKRVVISSMAQGTGIRSVTNYNIL